MFHITLCVCVLVICGALFSMEPGQETFLLRSRRGADRRGLWIPELSVPVYRSPWETHSYCIKHFHRWPRRQAPRETALGGLVLDGWGAGGGIEVDMGGGRRRGKHHVECDSLFFF